MVARSVVVASWVASVLVASVAHAEPTLPSPATYVPLSSVDQTLLDDGEISDGEQLGGAAAALVVGFGAGQAIQRRWHTTGWIFTLGDSASMALVLYGFGDAVTSCVSSGSLFTAGCGHHGNNVMIAGMAALGGLRLWQTLDALFAPVAHNRHVRALRAQHGLAPYVSSARGTRGGVAGLALRF